MDRVDVVVVGAGYAGLVAASTLRGTGLDVVVLEARDRVGGRAWTVDTAHGAGVDLGGQWIGPPQHRIVDWARRCGVATIDAPGGPLALQVDGAVHEASAGERLVGEVVDRLDRALAPVLSDLRDAEAPWASGRAAALDLLTVEQWVRDTLPDRTQRRIGERVLTSDMSLDLGEVSVLALAAATATTGGLRGWLDGSAESLIFAHGSADVPRVLATGLGDAVRLRHPVTALRTGDEGDGTVVHVDGPWGTTTARAVVLAVPPSAAADLLEADTSDLAVPTAALRARRHVTPGAVTKAVAVYERPHWSDAGTGRDWIRLGAPGIVSMVMDVSRGGQGMLATLVTGADHVAAADMGERELTDALRSGFAEVLGEGAPPPVELHVHDWAADPWTRGGYGQMPAVGTLTSTRVALAEPCGPVFFAGTETAAQWSGFFEGAIRSGERAAEQVRAALTHAPAAPARPRG